MPRLLACLCTLFAIADNPYLYRYGPDGLRLQLSDALHDTQHSWPRSLLSYPVDFTELAGDEADLRLFAADGRALSFQLADQRYEDGRLRFAHLLLMADLPTGARRDFHLASRPSQPAIREPAVSITKRDDGIVIDTGPLRIRLPAGNTVRPPLLQLERDDGWLGTARYSSTSRASHLDIEQTANGPLLAEFAVTVSFADGGVHHTRLRAIQGYDHVELHESIAGFSSSQDSRWEFRWVGGPTDSVRPATVSDTRRCWQLSQEDPSDTIAIFAIGAGLPVHVGEIRNTLTFAFPLQNGQRHSAIALGPPRAHCWHQQHYGDLPLDLYKDWQLGAPNPSLTFELFHAYRATGPPELSAEAVARVATIASAMPDHPMAGEWMDRVRLEPDAPLTFTQHWPNWALVPAATRYLHSLSAPVDGRREAPFFAPPIDALAAVDPMLAEHVAYMQNPARGTRPPLRSAIVPGHGLVLRGATHTDREVSLFVPEKAGDAQLVRAGKSHSLSLSGRASIAVDLGSLHYASIGETQLTLVDGDYLKIGAQTLYTSDAAPISVDRSIGPGFVRDFFDGTTEMAVFGGGSVMAHGVELSASPGLSANLFISRDGVARGEFFARRGAQAHFAVAPGRDLPGLRFIVDGQALPHEFANSAVSIGLPRGQHSWRIEFADSANSFALRINPPPNTPPKLHELLLNTENTWLSKSTNTFITPRSAYGICDSPNGGTLQLRFSSPENEPSAPLKLAAHWPMDAGKGDVASDVVGGAGAVLVGMRDKAWRKQPSGGYALLFDGEGQQLLSNLSVSLLQDCSIGVWFSTHALGALWSREIGTHSSLSLAVEHDGALRARVLGTQLRAPAGLNDGSWHHAVLTLNFGDKCQARLFVDGTPVDLQVTALVEGDDRDDPLRFGCAPPFSAESEPPPCFMGLVDDPRVYLSTLEPAAIAAWSRSGSGFSRPTLLLPTIDYAPSGQPYRRELRAVGTPAASIAVTGLPVWLGFDPLTSTIYGTPPQITSGTESELTVRATNSEGSDSGSFVVRVPGPVSMPQGLRAYVNGREVHGETDNAGLSIAMAPGRHRWELTQQPPRLRTPQISHASYDRDGASVHIDTGTDVRHWMAELSTDAGETWSVLQHLRTPQFRIAGNPGTRVWVRATGMAGREMSDPSPAYPIVFSDQPPKAPGLLRISLRDGAAVLRWSDVLGAKTYHLHRRVPGGAWSEIYAGKQREFADIAAGLTAPYDSLGLRAAASIDMRDVVLFEYAVSARNDNGISPKGCIAVADPRRWNAP
ncbi:MAG: hypothetical protein ACI8W8_002097 [Rhodothermales bacterium]|jgi:hypothetical protein